MLDALALLMSCREANLLLALLWLARIDLLVVVCVCLCVYGGTGICGQPFLQYPLCQSYVIFRLSQKACSFVGLCFFTVTQGSLYWEVYCPTKEAELYLLDCFHSIVHGSLVGGSIMFYGSMKWNSVRTRRL